MSAVVDRWAWLRACDPIHRDPRSGVFVLSRYQDVAAVLRSREASAAAAQQQRKEEHGVLPSMLTTDGQEHRHLRQHSAALIDAERLQSFSRPWRDAAVRLANAVPSTDEQVDVTARFAEPWATEVICDLLDVTDPTWRATLGELLLQTRVCLDPRPAPPVADQARLVNQALGSWLHWYLDTTSSPLVGTLHESLDRQQVVSLFALCAVGGWSPLADAATCAVALASERVPGPTPEDQASFVEEALRWHSPVPHIARTVRETVELASGPVGPGLIVGSLASANRDESSFPMPDRFDPDRNGPPPVAFGLGPHYCLGAPVVRTALGSLVGAMTDPAWPTVHPNLPLQITDTFPRRLADPNMTVGRS